MTEERKPGAGDAQPVNAQPEQAPEKFPVPETRPVQDTAPAPEATSESAPAAISAKVETASAPADEAPPPQTWSRRRKAKPSPPAKKRGWSRTAKHPFVVAGNTIISLLLVIMLAITAMVEYGRRQYFAKGPSTEDIVVDIRSGMGAQDIGDLLEQRGVISNSTLFTAGAVATGARPRLQAGEYRFPAGASMASVVEIIASGKVVEHNVTIPEGLTSEQIVQRLLQEEILTGPVSQIPPEGSLLPETYRISRGMSRQQLIERMTAARDKVLNEVWQNRDPDVPVKSPFELLVLASIIEKETGVGAERPMVASVFVNRLKQGMRLQSDPTIIYGLVGGKGTLGRPIQRGEITRRTAYNTYVINGLPPGPIANPGRAAIEAAARPAKSDYLYFVADGTGGHAFARTLQEHNQNVARWRQIERERGQAETDRVDPEDAPAGDQPSATGRRS